MGLRWKLANWLSRGQLSLMEMIREESAREFSEHVKQRAAWHRERINLREELADANSSHETAINLARTGAEHIKRISDENEALRRRVNGAETARQGAFSIQAETARQLAAERAILAEARITLRRIAEKDTGRATMNGQTRAICRMARETLAKIEGEA